VFAFFSSRRWRALEVGEMVGGRSRPRSLRTTRRFEIAGGVDGRAAEGVARLNFLAFLADIISNNCARGAHKVRNKACGSARGAIDGLDPLKG